MALTGIKVRQLLGSFIYERDGYTYINEADIKAATSAILKDNTNVYAMTKKDGIGRKFVVGNAKARVARPLLEAFVWESERNNSSTTLSSLNN